MLNKEQLSMNWLGWPIDMTREGIDPRFAGLQARRLHHSATAPTRSELFSPGTKIGLVHILPKKAQINLPNELFVLFRELIDDCYTFVSRLEFRILHIELKLDLQTCRANGRVV